nr:Protein F13B9.2 [Haemonchus contortus]
MFNKSKIRRHESAETVTKRTQTYVDSSREERIRREKEEEEELARVLDWEQKQIKELQERRERLKRERDEEIQRLLKKRAEEQAQLEAARAERRRVRALEERRKMLKEAKEERDRQEKLLVELERQKQTEIERLREQRSRQQLKEEEARKKIEIEERRRVKKEEENRRKREEEKRRRKEEEELRRKHQDEEGKETEEEEKDEEKGEDFDERRLGEELERRIMQKEEEQRQTLIREKSRIEHHIEHQQHQQRMAEDERRHMREEVKRFNMEKSKNERQSTRGQQRRRYIGMNQFEEKIEQKQEEEQPATTSINDENQMEETELSTFSVDDLSGRRRELLNKFGAQARHRNSEEKGKQTDEKSAKAKIYSTNELRSSAPDSEDGPEEGKLSRLVDRTKNENQSSEKEHENGVHDDDLNISENQGKPLVRKTVQRRLRGIKTFAEPKDVKSSVDDTANSDATYLGGWKESTENGRIMQIRAEQPPQRDAVTIERESFTNSKKASASQVIGHAIDDEYLKAYYEQYYNEWYRQHNAAAKSTSAPIANPIPRNQISLKMGSLWGKPENSSPPGALQPSQPSMPLQTFGTTASTNQATLSSEQLNKICADIKKATQDYGIRNPKSFALENCPLIQMYYKNVTCDQINHVMDYCAQNSLIV